MKPLLTLWVVRSHGKTCAGLHCSTAMPCAAVGFTSTQNIYRIDTYQRFTTLSA
jgi:hypothetical protein